MVKHAPPPTKFGKTSPTQAKSARATPAITNHLPPPTRYGSAVAAQPKAPPPARASHPAKPATAVAAPVAFPRNGALAPHVLQRTSISESNSSPWFKAGESKYYSSSLKTKIKKENGVSDIHVYLIDTVTGEAAYLHGEVATDGTAWIMTLDGKKFPRGRGSSYVLLQEFARVAKELGAKIVRLGTSVNKRSLEKSGYTPQTNPDEWAAVTVYGHMGWNVDTALTADASTVTPDELAQRAAAKVKSKNWI